MDNCPIIGFPSMDCNQEPPITKHALIVCGGNITAEQSALIKSMETTHEVVLMEDFDPVSVHAAQFPVIGANIGTTTQSTKTPAMEYLGFRPPTLGQGKKCTGRHIYEPTGSGDWVCQCGRKTTD